jgi:hypothetical protein
MSYTGGEKEYSGGAAVAQFYLLSIFANIVAGLTLAGDFLGERIPFLSSFKNLREDRTAQIVIGAVTLVIGAVKLFLGSPGEMVLIAGDLLPALTGIALGGVLLVEAFRADVEKQSGKMEKVKKISKVVLSYRVPLGIAGVAVAFVHFLLPGVIIL